MDRHQSVIWTAQLSSPRCLVSPRESRRVHIFPALQPRCISLGNRAEFRARAHTHALTHCFVTLKIPALVERAEKKS